MTTMTYFNTLRFVKKLEASGIPPIQAEAIAEAQQEAFLECIDNTLATKSDIARDIAEVRNEMADIRHEVADIRHEVAELRIEMRTGFKWIQWAVSLLAAGVGALILKTFFNI